VREYDTTRCPLSEPTVLSVKLCIDLNHPFHSAKKRRSKTGFSVLKDSALLRPTRRGAETLSGRQLQQHLVWSDLRSRGFNTNTGSTADTVTAWRLQILHGAHLLEEEWGGS